MKTVLRSFLMRHSFQLSTAISALLAGSMAQAVSTLDHGSLTPKGRYRGTLELQSAGGVNLLGRVDMGLNQSSAVRAFLGTGQTAVQWGLFYKWVPIPDYAKQPAIGLLAGFAFAHDNGKSAFSLRVHPHLSKRLDTEIGDIIPYVAIPISVRIADGATTMPVQLALGAEVKPNATKEFSFWLEGGSNIANAYGYISVAASHPF